MTSGGRDDTRILVVSGLLLGAASFAAPAAYLWRLRDSPFQRATLINPLYLIRLRSDFIDAFRLAELSDFNATHQYTNGVYTRTSLRFQLGNSSVELSVSGQERAQQIINKLRDNFRWLEEAARRHDETGLYNCELLYESSDVRSSSLWPLRLRRFSLAALFLGVITSASFWSLDAYNDYSDDEIKWAKATQSRTASGYRAYLANRKSGAYRTEAARALSDQYELAAARYKDAIPAEPSKGQLAVLEMLRYASRTGDFTVFVNFESRTRVNAKAEEGLRKVFGIRKLIPVENAFIDQANRARENRIISEIARSFARIIPADILEFRRGHGEEGTIAFHVLYAVDPSGDIYYPTRQENLPASQRDFYTGVSYQWVLLAAIQGQESMNYRFSVKSSPADLFQVASRETGSSSNLSPSAVYEAMANSAFDDFGRKLIQELGVDYKGIEGSRR